ncbi:GTP-binding protein 10 homolog [Toxorhynchites rutilus septentrionalis]|uniref:GTP-binding protein 10 homolog n=1 Tax=Toxorhynchites rutilus septentrionalis TaxID=329112 RepID=UPI00247A5E79|nr:GTP-binding protein 10 homolog [Toxorhynchites rutilus septentrionalis]
MVFLQNVLFKFVRKSIRKHLRGKFIDTLRLSVKGGHGGNGLPKYGGVGGQGGAVYFVAKEGKTLKDVLGEFSNKRVVAGNGEESSKARILGRRGLDREIQVPVGIRVLDDSGSLLAELDEEGKTCLAAGGGSGGCSGNSFLGKIGHTRTLTLDLKLIADVGLVGFPNAGKSTLVKALSNASPKIASYPFTTIRPQIGTIEYADYRQITIADLPGLIEGAHANFGMGHKFLKHVERTRLLLIIIDVFGFQLSQSHRKRNCLENIYSLNKELELYDKTLLEKPCVLLVNKMDKEGAIEEICKYDRYFNNLEDGLSHCPEELIPTQLINFERIIPISAKSVTEIDKVKQSIREVLDEKAEQKMRDVLDDKQRQAKLAGKLYESGPKIG